MEVAVLHNQINGNVDKSNFSLLSRTSKYLRFQSGFDVLNHEILRPIDNFRIPKFYVDSFRSYLDVFFFTR